MTTRVYRPDGDVDHRVTHLSDPLPALAGKRVVVLDNGKPNAVVVMTRAAETLAERTGATVSLVVKKGPGGRSANAAIPCAPEIFERVLAEADLVITGAADCGSCTAYSVHDAVELERCGIPTVLLTTTKFRPIAATLAAATGLPDLRTLVVDHPIGGVDRATLHERADAACDALVDLFTGSSTTRRRSGRAYVLSTTHTRDQNGAFAGAAEVADLRALVSADGADLETVSFDPDSGMLRLRLVIPDAKCAECVMPRAALESIAAARLGDCGVRVVEIEDPREPPT